MMMLSKLKVGLAVLVSAGFVAGGSGMLAVQGPGDKPGAEAAKVVVAPAAQEGTADSFRPRSFAELAQARIEAALQRYKAQRAFYEEGRITIDRLADSSRGLMQAERDAAATKAARVEAVLAHYNRLKEILKKEEAELEIGRATQADVAEAKTGLLDAEFALAKELEAPETPKPAVGDAKAGSKPPAATRPSLDQERVEIARRLYDTARKLYANATVEYVVVQEAAVTLAKAEEGAARTKADRVAAVRAQVDRLKEFVALNEARVQQARGTILDVDQARLRLMDAESHLLDVSGTPDGPGEGVAPTAGGPIPAAGTGESTAVSKWLGERAELAGKLLAEATKLFPSEIAVIDFVTESTRAMEAELDAATSSAGRQAAIQAQIDRLRPALREMEKPLRGEKRPSDIWRLRVALLDAEIALAREKEGVGSDPRSVADLSRRLSDVERKLDRLLNLIDAPKR